MAVVNWTREMATGLRSIDDDHRMLLDILNGLQSDAAESGAERRVGAALGALARYVDQHFAREERFLAQAGYPDLEEHAAAHERMTRHVHDTWAAWQADPGSADPGDLCTMLQDWLVRHIMGTDMQYVPFLKGERVGTDVLCADGGPARPVTLHLPHDRVTVGYRFARLMRSNSPVADRVAALVAEAEA